jgi:hypothetical protein
MLSLIQKRLVNWVDGMKISKNHLIQTEDYLIDVTRDVASLRLTDNNYGLLPPYKGESLSSDFEIINRPSNHVEINLKRCNAITAGGCRIHINPSDPSGYLHLDHAFDSGVGHKQNDEQPTWDVILVVKPFERIPAGIPDPEETPPRHPDSGQAYNLFIKPSGEINAGAFGMHHLTIGRIVKNGDRYEVDSSYIPPCTSMSSYPDLKDYYEKFGNYLNDIETSSIRIVQKIHDQENTSDIAQNISLLCENLLNYIATVYFNFKNSGRFYTPADIVNVFSSLAHVCFSAIQYMSKKQREKMLQYFHEWNDDANETPGKFTKSLARMSEITYNHQNIRFLMDEVETFISVFAGLWLKLSTLEYIGQNRENIVVAEKKQKQAVTPQSGWTILD